MVRLLNVNTLELHFFSAAETPPYIIASHRWTEPEATIDDVRLKQNTDTPGFWKIRAFCDYIRAMPGSQNFPWLWIDTCCIDKSSSAELSEAINSMFKWYRNSFFCLAFLNDVKSTDPSSLQHSEWFKRGWTLQELLAPHIVIFLDRKWQTIGHKRYSSTERIPTELSCGLVLNDRLAKITGIPADVLMDYESSATVTIEEKRSWLNGRNTTRKEDMVYCMLGLLGVSMSAIYGERPSAAWRRVKAALRDQEVVTEVSSSDNEAPYKKLMGFSNSAPRIKMSAMRRNVKMAKVSEAKQSTTEDVADITLETMYKEVVKMRELLERKNEEDEDIVQELLMQKNEDHMIIASLRAQMKAFEPSPDSQKAPIRFKDAVSRKFSFPWSTCKTWKGMESLIKQAFLHVDMIGDHVHQGHYDLTGPDGEIILPQVWDSMVQPGWAVEMHLWPVEEDQPAVVPDMGITDPFGNPGVGGFGAYDMPPEPGKKSGKKGKDVKKTKAYESMQLLAMLPPPPPPSPGVGYPDPFTGIGGLPPGLSSSKAQNKSIQERSDQSSAASSTSALFHFLRPSKLSKRREEP